RMLLCHTITRPPHSTTRIPYTTLFRSRGGIVLERAFVGGFPVVLVPLHRRLRAVDGVEDLAVRVAGQGDAAADVHGGAALHVGGDRKSTRLNSSHVSISYAGCCLNKKR